MGKFTLVRDIVRNSYGVSLICLLSYGWLSGKPLAIGTAATLTAASAGRSINHQLVSKRLDGAMRGQSEEIQVLVAQADLLKQALQENHGWYERYQAAEVEKERLGRLFDESKSELREAIDKLRAVEEANAEFQIEQKTWQVQSEAKMQPLKTEIERLKKVCEHYQKQYQASVEECNAHADSYNQLLARYEGLERENTTLKAPKRLPEPTPEQAMANRIADWLSMVTPSITAHVTQPAQISGEDWILWIDLENRNTAYRVAQLANTMRVDFGLPNNPTVKVNGDRVKIVIHRGERLDEYGVMRTDPMWLKDALVFEEKGKLFVHHARFSGESRSGKSTLISNAVGLLRMTIPQIQIELADPHSKGQSSWRSITPAYKGQADCLRGFQQFYQEFKRWDSSKEENPTPRLFILDEFDGMSKEFPEIVADAVDLWKNGRHEQFYLWVIGQSAGVGRFNNGQKPSDRLYLEDIKNLIQFWLADAIDRGLSEVNEQPAYKSAMRQAWLDAKAKGQRFIALCRPITVIGRSFIALMPSEGCFQAGAKTVREVLEESEMEQYENRASEEFNISQLERLFEQSPSEPEPTAPDANPNVVPNLPVKTRQKIEALIRKGHTTAQIVKSVWKINSSPHERYTSKRDVVEAIRKTL